MTQKVRIDFSSPGLEAPVYIAGSLGSQPWQPIEMDHARNENGELDFWKEFDAQEGEYQYKFRLGPGDWWVLDETKDIVDDGAGNRNNLLVVIPQAQKSSLDDTNVKESTSAFSPAAEAGNKTSEEALVPTAFEEPQQPAENLNTSNDLTPDSVQHEMSVPDSTQHQPHHESVKSSSLTRDSLYALSSIPGPTDNSVESDEDDLASPLFRHESLSVHGEDECASPLFRHESLTSISSLNKRRSVRSSSASSHRSQSFADEDVSEHVLERFPTQKDSIIDHLHRASSRLPEDETDVEGLAPSPTLSQHGFDSATSPSLAASRENPDYLGSIDEDEAEELSPEEDNTPQVPEGVTLVEIIKPVRTSPKLTIPASQTGTSHGQITPPMTPIDEMQGSDGFHDVTDDGSIEMKVRDGSSSSKSLKDDEDVATKSTSFWTWMGTFCGGRVGSVITVAVGVAAAFYAIVRRN